MTVAVRRRQGSCSRFADTGKAHQLSCPIVITSNLTEMPIVLVDAIVQAPQLAKQNADHSIGAAEQRFQVMACLQANRSGLQRQDDPRFTEQPADAIDGGGSLFNKSS